MPNIERAPLIPTEKIIEDVSEENTADDVEAPEFASSKIFDELLACFDDRNLPDNLRLATQNVNSAEKDSASEEKVIEADEESEQSEEIFVPLDHTISSPEDELFSQIFSEEKEEKKNKERDKKKWQGNNDRHWQGNNGKVPSLLTTIYDWLEVLVVSSVFAILLFTFVVRLAVVDGDSMNNTLHDKEMLVISNFMYEPEYSDIIVFSSPNYDIPLVKRVIATEGQTVDIDFENWKVIVDGKVLDEDYINYIPYQAMHTGDVSFPLTVPDGYVFVMGDNRNNSSDSRNARVGFVDERYILGKVRLRLTPFSKFGTVD
ncbi:MAG: signal peptidase I [Clostridia bacterium]|nr:signal peptidase I [Clostridia bacterium]